MFPEFRTDRLLLRKILPHDQSKIFEGLSHREVVRYYGISFSTLEEAYQQMEWFEKLEKTRTGIWWAICSLDNLQFYGAGGFNHLMQDHQKAEMGFWLLPAYWGQGIMAEALPLIINYAFSQLSLHRIEGFVENENLNSKKVFHKLNFVHEATLRECEIKNEQYISLDIYAKLNPTHTASLS